MPTSTLATYLSELRREAEAPDPREHSYRPALKSFCETLAERLDRPLAALTLEPGRGSSANAPDAVLYGPTTSDLIGYIETKDLGADLDALSGQNLNQFRRYLAAFPVWVFTNYLEFRLYEEGSETLRVHICDKTQLMAASSNRSRLADRKAEEVSGLFDRFLQQSVPVVASPERLARLLAHKAQLLEGVIRGLLTGNATEDGEPDPQLKGQLESYRRWLISDLDEERFADLYAQTITYGLFLAAFENTRRYSPLELQRHNLLRLLPTSVGPVRALFQLLAGDFLPHELDWIIDDIIQLLGYADLGAIAEQFSAGSADPTIHFYETFLAHYDPEERERLGSYYTPDSVVDYIVNSVDELLRRDFGKADGLAAPEVTLLDPSLGTGTFMVHALRKVADNFGEEHAGDVPDHVRDHTLQNFYGFELQAAPYVLAHLKLEQLLAEMGVEGRRPKVYLTNTLSDHTFPPTLPGVFEQAISEDGRAASRVKDEEKILVVMGNPPYQGTSYNVYDRVADYRVPGERARNWLQNDYVKFIRWAEYKIAEAPGIGYTYGIIAYITDSSYLRAPLFRGMRKHLLDNFTRVYVLNLHGNTRVGEALPEGVERDESVFDIQQGTAILLLVRDMQEGQRAPRTGEVYYADVWGGREPKYRYLASNSVNLTGWERLVAEEPSYFFVPIELPKLKAEYEKWPELTSLMTRYSQAVISARDKFAYALDRETLVRRVSEFARSSAGEEETERRFHVRSTREFDVDAARRALASENVEDRIVPAVFRPFDHRWIYYSNTVLEWPRTNVFGPLLKVPGNLALVAFRHTRRPTHARVFISRHVVDARLLSSESNCYAMPLYLPHGPDDADQTKMDVTSGVGREPNLHHSLVPRLSKKYGRTVSPEEILGYIYGVLNTPTYQTEFETLLRDYFPRIPFTTDRTAFETMAERGQRIVELHLLEAADLRGMSNLTVGFPENGTNKVARGYPKFDPGEARVHINPEQHFSNVTQEMWDYEVGGYAPLEKWLDDRRKLDVALSAADRRHYETVATSIRKAQEEVPLLEVAWQRVIDGTWFDPLE